MPIVFTFTKDLFLAGRVREMVSTSPEQVLHLKEKLLLERKLQWRENVVRKLNLAMISTRILTVRHKSGPIVNTFNNIYIFFF